MMDDAIFIKALVVGDSGVGKTSILNQYCYNKFDTSVNPTIGCDFCLKVLDDFQGKTIRLQLWDIAGQDRYTAVSRLYVKGALGCIVVADVMNPESLNTALKWKEVIEENADFVGNNMIPLVLLQNKCDLIENQPKKQEFQTLEYLTDFAEKNNFKSCFQVSAKSDINLNLAMEDLLNHILKLNALDAPKDNFAASERASEFMRLSKQSVLNTERKTLNQRSKENNTGGGCSC